MAISFFGASGPMRDLCDECRKAGMSYSELSGIPHFSPYMFEEGLREGLWKLFDDAYTETMNQVYPLGRKK